MKILITVTRASLLLVILLNIGCNTKPVKKKATARYVKEIDSLMSTSFERELFNGNVLIAKNDTIVYKKSFGYTDATQQIKLDDKSIFNIGSIAKEFNGVAIMILVEKGLLSLDDPISKFDLDLPAWSEKVTVNHLINYAGGIPPIDPKLPPNDNEAWEIIRGTDSLLFEPGTNFRYDNSNVFLQRRILEKVTGKTFQDFVKENIIEPLNMTNSVFDPPATTKHRTSCYDFEKNPCPELEFISGWLWVDSNDLYKWIKAMNSNQLISQESFNILLQNPYAEDKTSSLGEYFKEKQLQRHNGVGYKFESIFLNDFENDIIIIIVSNNKNRVWDLGHEAYNIMLRKEFNIPKRSVFQFIRKDCLEDVEKGIEAYHNLKKIDSGDYAFDDPNELNRLGYELIRAEKPKEAVKIFELAISEFPENANLYDSSGEAYFVNREYDLALINYKKSLELNPKNKNAVKMIEKINSIKE
ncbi:serine hydrolase [Aquimarina macrocephali]|uniref:serine hydrolase n=1 Tax=Aquimarina macrocephali TaxID=666563 RepID=UPI003F66CE5D